MRCSGDFMGFLGDFMGFLHQYRLGFNKMVV